MSSERRGAFEFQGKMIDKPVILKAKQTLFMADRYNIERDLSKSVLRRTKEVEKTVFQTSPLAAEQEVPQTPPVAAEQEVPKMPPVAEGQGVSQTAAVADEQEAPQAPPAAEVETK
jgi:dihydroorotase-like cyclic amidohydrolase